jgi:hypothetical protein
VTCGSVCTARTPIGGYIGVLLLRAEAEVGLGPPDCKFWQDTSDDPRDSEANHHFFGDVFQRV